MDQRILLALHEHATPLLDAVFRVSHELGTDLFLALFVVALMAVHRLRGERRETLAWLGLGLSTLFLVEGLKLVVGRPRPQLWPRLVEATGYSFPSGHALGSAALYGFLAHVLARRWPRHRLALYAGGILTALYVGGGRLYLGVHWPSDVLAGWTLGALLCGAAASWLDRGRLARTASPG
jgi:undecaprenyl-diphosphatase